MCGIAGIFGEGGVAINPNNLQKMIDAINHRGPDGDGIVRFQNAGLGHVRLAIIDVSGGSQPMACSEGRFHLSYNGELYNYKKIRKDLVAKGYSFKTASDTEAILYACQEYGVAGLSQFRGMFAFALWDESLQEGWLVRDRFGIKPLFISQQGGQLFFASEAKAILPLLGRAPVLNRDSLHLLMNFRYVPGNATLFQGIDQLNPGNILIWNKNGIEIKSWVEEDKSPGYGDIETIRGLLQQAVQRQLVSDVPLGAYLSGGIDSGSLVAIASECRVGSGADFPTFTIETGDDRNEADNAEDTAKLLQLPNFREKIQESLPKDLRRLIYHLEVPKVNSWQSALVAKLASKHVKVALSGLGGDEIFLGYNIHSMLANLERFQKGFRWGMEPLGKTMQFVAGKLGLAFEEFERAGKILSKPNDFSHAYGVIRNVWDSPEGRRRLYGHKMRSGVYSNAYEVIDKSWNHTKNPVSEAARFELKNKMINDLLLQEDRLSMAFGLEVRVPFLDEDLVNHVSACDIKLLMKHGKKKGLMKEVVGQWVPKEILSRKKSGFQLPIHEVFQLNLRPLCETHLSKKRIQEDGLFNYTFIQEVLSAKPHFRLRWHYFLLFLMIGFNVWQDIFIRGEPVGDWS